MCFAKNSHLYIIWPNVYTFYLSCDLCHSIKLYDTKIRPSSNSKNCFEDKDIHTCYPQGHFNLSYKIKIASMLVHRGMLAWLNDKAGRSEKKSSTQHYYMIISRKSNQLLWQEKVPDKEVVWKINTCNNSWKWCRIFDIVWMGEVWATKNIIHQLEQVAKILHKFIIFSIACTCVNIGYLILMREITWATKNIIHKNM